MRAVGRLLRRPQRPEVRPGIHIRRPAARAAAAAGSRGRRRARGRPRDEQEHEDRPDERARLVDLGRRRALRDRRPRPACPARSRSPLLALDEVDEGLGRRGSRSPRRPPASARSPACRSSAARCSIRGGWTTVGVVVLARAGALRDLRPAPRRSWRARRRARRGPSSAPDRRSAAPSRRSPFAAAPSTVTISSRIARPHGKPAWVTNSVDGAGARPAARGEEMPPRADRDDRQGHHGRQRARARRRGAA